LRLIERRIEELDDPGALADEAAVEVFHGLRHVLVRAGTGKDRPALRDGIDLALRISRGSERGAVVEIGAAIPLTVPAVFGDVASQPTRFERVFVGGADISTPTGEFDELHQHIVEEEGEPDA